MTNALINGNAAATTALFAMGGILATSNKYIEQVFRLSQTYPRELTGGFVVGFVPFSDCIALIKRAFTSSFCVNHLFFVSFIPST